MIEVKGKYTSAQIMIDNVEESCIKQIHNMVSHPAATNPIAIMPDTHAGAGCVIGFTMKCGDKIVPNWIGVDIGCGMIAARYDHHWGEFMAKDFQQIDETIAKDIPMGKNVHTDYNTEDRIHTFKGFLEYNNVGLLDCRVDSLIKDVGISREYFAASLGSLGGGNHFIELGVDEENSLWSVIHTGSRNFGLKVAQYHQKIAKSKSDMGDASYLEGEDKDNYIRDMIIAQLYARWNRKYIQNELNLILSEPNLKIETEHNFIDPIDNVIRKGAVKANEGQLFVLPFNMRDGTLICEGKGNEDWNNSSPHGAGRIMSRSGAKKNVTLEEFQESMKGIYSTCIDQSRIDESPMAYKDCDIIEEAISPTADIVHRIKPIYNRKG